MKFTVLFTNIVLLALFMQSPILQAMKQTEEPVISEVKAKEEQTEPETCTICLNDDNALTYSNSITVTCCEQNFHFNCLDEWVYTADNQTKPCPLCKQQFPKETVEAILVKRVAQLVVDGKNPATALKRVNLKDGEYFFKNKETWTKIIHQIRYNFLQSVVKNDYLKCTELLFQHFKDEMYKAEHNGDQITAQIYKVLIDKFRQAEAKNNISGFLKYHCPRVYGIIDTVRNPLLYGLAGAGISSLTGLDIKKGFILGSAAAAAIKVLNSSNNFYKEEAHQQKFHSSWHSPITGFFRPHTLKQSFLGVLTALGAINIALPKDPTTGFIALGSALTTGVMVTNFSRLIVGINQSRSSQRQQPAR